MALPTANLSVNAIKAALGVATAREIFYIGATLKTAAQLGALVSAAGLNPTYCPGADATARLANLLADRKLSYFKGYNPIIDYLSCTPISIYFPKEGSGGSFEISSNLAWTITEAIGWLTLSAISGTGTAIITATALVNGSTQNRMGSFTVQAPGFSKTINVEQEGSHI